MILPVMEAFYTIQGEGAYTGHSAYFVRLGGCDVGCVWCDVKESWDANAHPQQTITSIVSEARSYAGDVVVVTGGEPFMHDLTQLTNEIHRGGLRTHVETAGVHSITGNWDWICFSPKKFKKPLSEYYERAQELKVVIYHPSDLKWAEGHAKKCSESVLLYLQPEWSKRESLMPLIVDYVKENPKWRISLQTHKYLNIP